MQKLDMRLVRRMLRIFLILTIASITVLMILTVTEDTLPSLKKLNPLFLSLALLNVLVYILLETLWLRILVWCVSGWISLRGALEFILGGTFLTLVPFGIAGVPLQMYVLYKEKRLSIGSSGSIMLMRSAILTLMLPLALPVVYLYYSSVLNEGFVLHITRYLLVIVGVAVLLLVLASINTDRTRNFILKFAKTERARNIALRISREIKEMKSTIRMFFILGRWKLPLAFLLACISRISLFFLPYPILKGLGLSPPVGQVMIIQLLLTYLLLFSPTPGASGIAEGGGFLLFRPICPEYLLGIFVVLWRFFSYYLQVILGGIILARMASAGGLELKKQKGSTSKSNFS